MRKKSFSTLGYIMECLNIQTISLSRALHVDASLVSKWKTGDRTLSGKSIYFDSIIDFLMEESKKSNHRLLKNALMDLYPHETIAEDSYIEPLLRQALTDTKAHGALNGQQKMLEGEKTVPTVIFEENLGRRAAIAKLLDYADAMSAPGEIVFIDSEEYTWLLEDSTFSETFTQRIETLLRKDFHAKFVIHYSSHKEPFVRLFNACSPLIFHRNVEWYYYEYYDENIFNFSFFILNRAIALLGLSAENGPSTTMVFTDTSLVIRYEALANQVMNQCSRLFSHFESSQFEEVIQSIHYPINKGAFYSFLPAPAFLFAGKTLLKEILLDNGVDEKNIEKCLQLNHKLRQITASYFSDTVTPKEPFIYIFQLEEMLKRVRTRPFISESLTLLGGKSVKIRLHQYAQELRALAARLERYANLQIVLVSEKDGIALPTINCWARQNMWMVQMDYQGFRLSDEISMVNATSVTLERCIRKVPPERKEKDSVRRYLLDLAEELESQTIH